MDSGCIYIYRFYFESGKLGFCEKTHGGLYMGTEIVYKKIKASGQMLPRLKFNFFKNGKVLHG